MYFESFYPGFSTVTPRKTITAGELDAFIELTGLDLPLFRSDAHAREVGHPRRLVTGPMLLAVAMGLVRAHGWFDQVVAVLEFTDMRFLKPVHPGDTLRVAIQTVETRPTRDTGRGLVVLHFDILDQNDSTVLQMNGSYLFRRQPLEEKT